MPAKARRGKCLTTKWATSILRRLGLGCCTTRIWRRCRCFRIVLRLFGVCHIRTRSRNGAILEPSCPGSSLALIGRIDSLHALQATILLWKHSENDQRLISVNSGSLSFNEHLWTRYGDYYFSGAGRKSCLSHGSLRGSLVMLTAFSHSCFQFLAIFNAATNQHIQRRPIPRIFSSLWRCGASFL